MVAIINVMTYESYENRSEKKVVVGPKTYLC